ncbi:MAG: GNAT family N-acetyltransferase [Gammaproteobacteria bacterium]
MIKQIIKTSRLDKSELRHIRLLADRAAARDGYKVKIYWHIVENRLTREFNDFFYYLDGNLIGYLAIYTFENHEAEMSAVVHPSFRRKGIFKKLLSEAVFEFKQRNINSCVWVCPRQSPLNTEYLQAREAKYTFSQIEMMAQNEPEAAELPPISLQLATKEDLVTLAQLGSTSFNSSFTDTLQRFTENMTEKNRVAWLASIPDHPNIGKIHVRYDVNKTAFIHDLCILPEFRGRRLAMSMILQTMRMLRNKGQRNFMLDVECHNEGALKLYEKCGFVTTAAFDFWQVEVDRMM